MGEQETVSHFSSVLCNCIPYHWFTFLLVTHIGKHYSFASLQVPGSNVIERDEAELTDLRKI